MDLETLLSYNWLALLPEFIILGVATAMTLLDLFLSKKMDRKWIGWLGAVGIAASFIALLFILPLDATSILYDTFYLDGFAKAFKIILLLAGLFIIILAVASSDSEQSQMEKYRSEYYYLLLAALLGGMVVTSSADLITLFIGLELLSISTYILVGLRKNHLSSTEAAMKYVINGAIASAITLFGFSYLYGLTGTTNIREMGEVLFNFSAPGDIYLLITALVLTVVGLSFKLATVPFYMWVPDVYEGAPTIVTAFLTVISKAVGFALLIRVLYAVFARVPIAEGGTLLLQFQNIFVLIAIVTMVVGNIMAIRQQNVKRLFAFSSVAHAGYLFAAFASFSYLSLDAVWFYLLAYAFMNIGVFAIIYFLTNQEDSAHIHHFAGLYKRSPLLAITMSIFLLSLASIPGTAGFIGKLKIIMSTLMIGEAQYLLVTFIVVTTVISYFYYFRIMVQMFFRPAPEGKSQKLSVRLPFFTIVTLCATALVVFGLAPNLALDFLYQAIGGASGLWQ